MSGLPKLSARDEGPIWLTSMGLSVGLVMIVCLLGLVAINGFSVFWPHALARIAVAGPSDDAAPQILEGVVVKKQDKAAPGARRAGAREWQMYRGNKDRFGQAFHYVDEPRVQSVDYPKELALIERLEYGHAIGVPLRIEVPGGTPVAAGSVFFEKSLDRLLHEARQRRERIRKLEKTEIGALNAKMEALRLKERRLGAGPARDAARLESESLRGRYAERAAQARVLRAAQQHDALVVRLAGGQEHRIAFSQIVRIQYPNRMNFFEKCVDAAARFWAFLSQEPREANTEGGVFPAIFGTFVMTLLMSLAVAPFGVLAAIYLREYARQGFLVRAVRIAVNNLAGVPSIVFGVFGLGFFVYFVGGTVDSLFFRDRLPTPTFGTGGILWASLTLALMTVPVVIVATEEALAAVARGVREGSLACGASKWQTIQHVVLPASAPGIMTGLILAMARGAGEVAPLMLVGVVKLAPSLPLDMVFPFMHPERKFMHLGFHIYDLGFQSPDSEAAKPMVFATTLLLIGLVVALNLTAILIRERLRRKYAVGAFS